jgi:hypothetical protein
LVFTARNPNRSIKCRDFGDIGVKKWPQSLERSGMKGRWRKSEGEMSVRSGPLTSRARGKFHVSATEHLQHPVFTSSFHSRNFYFPPHSHHCSTNASHIPASNTPTLNPQLQNLHLPTTMNSLSLQILLASVQQFRSPTFFYSIEPQSRSGPHPSSTW